MLMVLIGTMVAGVCYGEGGESQLFRQIQLGETVFPKAHHVLATAVSSRKDPLAVHEDTTTAQVFAMEQPHLPRL